MKTAQTMLAFLLVSASAFGHRKKRIVPFQDKFGKLHDSAHLPNLGGGVGGELQLTWCNKTIGPIRIDALTITPPDIKEGETITLSVKGQVLKPITDDAMVTVKGKAGPLKLDK